MRTSLRTYRFYPIKSTWLQITQLNVIISSLKRSHFSHSSTFTSFTFFSFVTTLPQIFSRLLQRQANLYQHIKQKEEKATQYTYTFPKAAHSFKDLAKQIDLYHDGTGLTNEFMAHFYRFVLDVDFWTKRRAHQSLGIFFKAFLALMALVSCVPSFFLFCFNLVNYFGMQLLPGLPDLRPPICLQEVLVAECNVQRVLYHPYNKKSPEAAPSRSRSRGKFERCNQLRENM